jgi:hypothetical protein
LGSIAFLDHTNSDNDFAKGRTGGSNWSIRRAMLIASPSLSRVQVTASSANAALEWGTRLGG